VIYVVDGGKAKEIGYDHETGLSRLEEELVTRASANQRRGRAGRTQPGKCYKMFTRRDEENMRKFPVPEMQRVPLESLSLQVKVTRPDEDAKVSQKFTLISLSSLEFYADLYLCFKLYLGRAIDPPKVAAMEKAWSTLEDLGAIDPDGNLAALGRYMVSPCSHLPNLFKICLLKRNILAQAMLPVDLRLGKMLILATLFGCLSPMLTIAACLSSKPLFVNPMDKRDEANKYVHISTFTF
jgi:HrpA-like RNA helicase